MLAEVDQGRGGLARRGDCRGNRGGAGDEFDRADSAKRRRAVEGARSFGCAPIRWRSATESRSTPGRTRAVTVATSRRRKACGLAASECRPDSSARARCASDPACGSNRARDWHRPPITRSTIRGDAALTIMLVMNLQPHEAQPPFDTVLGIGNPASAGRSGTAARGGGADSIVARIMRCILPAGWTHDASLGHELVQAVLRPADPVDDHQTARPDAVNHADVR